MKATKAGAMLEGDLLGVVPIAILLLLAFAVVGHLVLTKSRTGVYRFRNFESIRDRSNVKA